MGENKKVLVIGLDGATWNIIEPMVRQGKLPTIERLMKSGCYGNLESCIPACTFPAWKCYSTGKEPGKLGVYSFLDVDVIKQEITLANSTSFKSDELWDILSANNITCGVINMPTTYPPKAINGAMISPGTPKHAGFAYPESLEQELINRFNYKMDPDYLPELSKDAAIPSIKHIINQTFDVASYLLQKFDLSFLHITIFDIDTIHHHYWKDMEDDDAKYGRVIEDFWVLIDSRIGSLLAEFGTEKTYVFLMSDHGQTRMKGMFYINKWLQEKNMMTMRTQKLGMIPRLAKLSQTNTAINHILGAMLTLPRFRSFIRRMAGQLSLNPLSNQIDWSQSKVIPTTFGLIYINRLIIDSADQLESLKQNLIEDLKSIEEPTTREKLAKAVYRRKEIYSVSHADRAPDIIIVPNEGWHIATSATSIGIWGRPIGGWTAVHHPQGIFLATGPEIRKNVEIQGAKIYDLAPTILHVLGIPIPKDMDGKVMKEISEAGSALANREIKYQDVDEKAMAKRKIKELKSQGKI